jgi:hypothetical protein
MQLMYELDRCVFALCYSARPSDKRRGSVLQLLDGLRRSERSRPEVGLSLYADNNTLGRSEQGIAVIAQVSLTYGRINLKLSANNLHSRPVNRW